MEIYLLAINPVAFHLRTDSSELVWNYYWIWDYYWLIL